MYGQTNGIRGVDIVESGSNENGNWIKYADGTMMCWHTESKVLEVTRTWGAWYESIGFVWRYPQVFVSVPSCSCSRLGGMGASIEFSGDATTELSPAMHLVRPVQMAESTYVMSYFAIGKWR